MSVTSIRLYLQSQRLSNSSFHPPPMKTEDCYRSSVLYRSIIQTKLVPSFSRVHELNSRSAHAMDRNAQNGTSQFVSPSLQEIVLLVRRESAAEFPTVRESKRSGSLSTVLCSLPPTGQKLPVVTKQKHYKKSKRHSPSDHSLVFCEAIHLHFPPRHTLLD